MNCITPLRAIGVGELSVELLLQTAPLFTPLRAVPNGLESRTTLLLGGASKLKRTASEVTATRLLFAVGEENPTPVIAPRQLLSSNGSLPPFQASASVSPAFAGVGTSTRAAAPVASSVVLLAMRPKPNEISGDCG